MMIKKIEAYTSKFLRRVFGPVCIRKPRQKDCILLTNNCLGGFLYHDWKMAFSSPTINLQMAPETLLEFYRSLPESLDWDFQEVPFSQSQFDQGYSGPRFPVGRFQAGEVYFQHYHSFEEAAGAWKRRAARMKEQLRQGKAVNVAILADTISPEVYRQFRELPCNKALILRHAPREWDDAFVLNMDKDKVWYDFCGGFSPRKFYEQFDFAGWVK